MVATADVVWIAMREDDALNFHACGSKLVLQRRPSPWRSRIDQRRYVAHDEMGCSHPA